MVAKLNLFETDQLRITPPLKWHGGKNYLAERIIGLMPPRCKKPNAPAVDDPGYCHFVEPFFGGGAVLLANDPEGTRSTGGGAVTFTAAANLVNGMTVVTLSGFTGSEAEFGSLKDGRYTLTVLASQVTFFGQQLDGDSNATPGGDFVFGETQGLFRFYGAMNGDRRVDISDFGFFSPAYLTPANYNAALDFNNDGRIDISEFGQFSVRYFTSLP